MKIVDKVPRARGTKNILRPLFSLGHPARVFPPRARGTMATLLGQPSLACRAAYREAQP
jgi:hypothetical protein